MTFRLAPAFFAFVTLALAVAACGGDDDGGSTTDAPTEVPVTDLDVCALLTEDEVEEALNEAVVDVVPEDLPPSFFCDWFTENDNGVSIEVLTSDKESREAYYDSAGDDIETVPGLGERAQYTSYGAVEVLTEDYVISLFITSDTATDEEIREETITLMELALPRIPDREEPTQAPT